MPYETSYTNPFQHFIVRNITNVTVDSLPFFRSHSLSFSKLQSHPLLQVEHQLQHQRSRGPKMFQFPLFAAARLHKPYPQPLLGMSVRPTRKQRSLRRGQPLGGGKLSRLERGTPQR